MSARRGFVLCLDGENLEDLERFAADFELPHIRALLEGGLRGALDPGLLPVSAPAWATFMTGCGFERHGVYGFMDHDVRGHRDALVDFRSMRRESLFSLADRQGAAVLGLNLPLSSPPPALRHGRIVSGFLVTTRDGLDTWPPELAGEIRALIPEYETRLPDATGAPARARRSRLESLRDIARRMRWRPAVLRHLLARGVPRLAVVHCQETDVLHHMAWDLVSGVDGGTDEERGVVREIYRTADELAGLLREVAAPGGVGLLLSDHGGQKMEWVVQPNDILADWGLAVLLDGAAGSLARRDEFGQSPAVRIRRWLRRTLGRRGEPPSERFRSAHLDRELLLDFARTRLYAAIGDNACVFFRGDGPRQTAEELEGVRTRLAGLRLPDGGPVFGEVRTLGGALDGGAGAHLPVLAARSSDGVYISRRTGGGAFHRVEDPAQGTHRQLGMYCWSGPGVAACISGRTLRMEEVLPTMFAALGLAIPSGLDGAPWTEVPPAGPASEWSECRVEGSLPAAPATEREEEEALRERLRGLGYLG